MKEISNQEKWDRRFLSLAREVSTWSKDPSTKVGAILVDFNNRVVATGYNGFPMGCDDDPSIYADRERKYRRVVHAEANAILMAGHRSVGTRLYVYPTFAAPNVCCECCKLVLQAGIFEIVSYEVGNTRKDKERRKRKRADGSTWEDSIREAALMCREAGVRFRSIKP